MLENWSHGHTTCWYIYVYDQPILTGKINFIVKFIALTITRGFFGYIFIVSVDQWCANIKVGCVFLANNANISLNSEAAKFA